jgi:hypothetical protein
MSHAHTETHQVTHTHARTHALTHARAHAHGENTDLWNHISGIAPYAPIGMAATSGFPNACPTYTYITHTHTHTHTTHNTHTHTQSDMWVSQCLFDLRRRARERERGGGGERERENTFAIMRVCVGSANACTHKARSGAGKELRREGRAALASCILSIGAICADASCAFLSPSSSLSSSLPLASVAALLLHKTSFTFSTYISKP